MEFNWADPRKNKLVNTVMMAKAEASRVKRLTSVKSTVSNQLNPAVEHKLKTLKKKKGPEAPDERPSSRLHQREFDVGNNNNNNGNGRASGGNNSNNHSFYTELLPQAARPKSIFDGFDVHAAADGLFHPASNVQAFAEHDARYPATRDKDSGRSTATTTTTSSSSSNRSTKSTQGADTERRLPPLSGASDRSERLASRSESRLPTAASSSSSLSCASHRSLSGLGGNRSDGDLHAPRRVGIVPSSADRNAMELLAELEDDDAYDSHEEQKEDDEPQAPSPEQHVKVHRHKKEKAQAAVTRDAGNNEEHHAVPLLDLDLTHKFERLKTMIKTNREKETAEETTTPLPRGPEIDDDRQGDGRGAPIVTLAKKAKDVKVSKPTKDKATAGKKHASTTATSSSSLLSAVEPSAARGPTVVVARKPKPKTLTTDVTVRNGVSLSDLKEEHRVALAMLQELGGPVDEPDATSHQAAKPSRVARAPATSKAAAGPSQPTKRSSADTTMSVTTATTRPTGSAGDRSSRLVEKLRARIPSGRDRASPSSHEALDSDDAPTVASTTEEASLQSRELVSAALDAARAVLQAREEAMAVPTSTPVRRETVADGAKPPPPQDEQDEHEKETDANERLWQRYNGDDAVDDDDADPSAELYDDEYFEGQ